MSEPKTIEQIVKTWLEEYGYDGLVYPELECGCGLDDFMPCGEADNQNCKPAYLWSDGFFYLRKEIKG